jgi:coatomer subunit beta'
MLFMTVDLRVYITLTYISKMSLRLDIKKKLLAHSPRVKSVDFHPDLPWILSALYNGSVAIHDYQNQTCIKTLEVSQVPVRSARFLAKKQWIVAGSDDMMIRVYNYNTMERVKAFEAHGDFLRCIVVHPQDNFIISCSDDFTIRLW